MSAANPLWEAPRIHGELLKLGFEVARSSVAKYMLRRFGPPSQGWRNFLRNDAPTIVGRISSQQLRGKNCATQRQRANPNTLR